MFEKEAEEYANKYGQDAFTQFNMSQMIEPVRMERKLGFQKGAEFGYNKANEWHFVKDGDLPKDEEFKWCISDIGNPYVARWSEILNCWEGTMYQEVCCPYAWKEIELPELKESE